MSERLDGCRHIVGETTTLRTHYASGPGGSNARWVCACRSCGRETEPCRTYQEAIAMAKSGRWKDE